MFLFPIFLLVSFSSISAQHQKNTDVVDLALIVAFDKSTKTATPMREILKGILDNLNIGESATKVALVEWRSNEAQKVIPEGDATSLRDKANKVGANRKNLYVLNKPVAVLRQINVTGHRINTPAITVLLFQFNMTSTPIQDLATSAFPKRRPADIFVIVFENHQALIYVNSSDAIVHDLSGDAATAELGKRLASIIHGLLATCAKNPRECYYLRNQRCVHNISCWKKIPEDCLSDEMCEETCNKRASRVFSDKCKSCKDVKVWKIYYNESSTMTRYCKREDNSTKEPCCKKMDLNLLGNWVGSAVALGMTFFVLLIATIAFIIQICNMDYEESDTTSQLTMLEQTAGPAVAPSMMNYSRPPSLTSTPMEELVQRYAKQTGPEPEDVDQAVNQALKQRRTEEPADQAKSAPKSGKSSPKEPSAVVPATKTALAAVVNATKTAVVATKTATSVDVMTAKTVATTKTAVSTTKTVTNVTAAASTAKTAADAPPTAVSTAKTAAVGKSEKTSTPEVKSLTKMAKTTTPEVKSMSKVVVAKKATTTPAEMESKLVKKS